MRSSKRNGYSMTIKIDVNNAVFINRPKEPNNNRTIFFSVGRMLQNTLNLLITFSFSAKHIGFYFLSKTPDFII